MLNINNSGFLYNQIKRTNNQMHKAMSNLSSGKRINTAADDAAGISIS